MLQNTRQRDHNGSRPSKQSSLPASAIQLPRVPSAMQGIHELTRPATRLKSPCAACPIAGAWSCCQCHTRQDDHQYSDGVFIHPLLASRVCECDRPPQHSTRQAVLRHHCSQGRPRSRSDVPLEAPLSGGRMSRCCWSLLIDFRWPWASADDNQSKLKSQFAPV